MVFLFDDGDSLKIEKEEEIAQARGSFSAMLIDVLLYFFLFFSLLACGIGIFQVDGPEWRFQRKLARHIFNVKAFKEYVSEVVVNEGHKVIDYLGKAADQGPIVDFHQLMMHYTLDSFGAYVSTLLSLYCRILPPCHSS